MARKLIMIGMLALLVLSAGVVAAEEDTTDDVPPTFTDGRVNAYDTAAPVAVYYTTKSQRMLDDDGQPAFREDGSEDYADVVTGLELYAVDGDGNGRLILSLSKADIQAALDAGQTSFAADGFQLNVAADGWYWLVSPADPEGKSYSFSWEDLGRTLPTSVAPVE